MSIPVTCPDCQSHFHVGEEFAGRPGRCPDCGSVLNVPEAPVAVDEHPDPRPYWAPGPEAIEEPFRRPRRDHGRDHEHDLREDFTDEPRNRRFDPHGRAARWARVHRGLGYLQVAVVLGFLSQILQTVLMLARGGVPQNPNGLPDSGQVALVFGALALILAAGMFWLLGRAAGIRVPYVPARNCAKPSFVMALGTVGGFVATFCLLVGFIGAAAPAGANGAPPPPAAVLFMLLMMAAFCLTAGLAVGAEIAGLVGLARIADALRDRAAAGWARRSIVVMLLAGAVMLFGLCGVSVYAAQQEQERQKAQAGPAGVNGAPANGKKDAAPAQPPAAAPAANPPPDPIDGTLALVFDLVFFGPLILYLLHFTVALQTGRRAIRREIDALTGQDHGDHDRPY